MMSNIRTVLLSRNAKYSGNYTFTLGNSDLLRRIVHISSSRKYMYIYFMNIYFMMS